LESSTVIRPSQPKPAADTFGAPAVGQRNEF